MYYSKERGLDDLSVMIAIMQELEKVFRDCLNMCGYTDIDAEKRNFEVFNRHVQEFSKKKNVKAYINAKKNVLIEEGQRVVESSKVNDNYYEVVKELERLMNILR